MNMSIFRTGFRTLWVNFVLVLPVLADVLVQLILDAQFAAIIPPEYYPLYTLAVLFINAYMRTITRTPVGEPVQPQDTQ